MDIKLGANRIRQLVDAKKESVKGLSVNKMLHELSLSPDIVDNMRKGHVPSADKIQAIAAYLNVSVPYILGNSDEKEPASPEEGKPLSAEDMEMAREISKLPPEDRKRMADYLGLLRRQDKS
ncbi:MAG: hypothetical protein LBR76_00075 [Oscillospiraceae bacterium]|jgi:transcriptional regulator with XRE-family HTH domain|nr:hypothetical protein [Oscillospiraceae bacterium]